jgi:hypothetical protein
MRSGSAAAFAAMIAHHELAPPSPMHLWPYVKVDDTPFDMRRDERVRRRGPPLRSARNAVGLNELDYGDVVFRVQDSGRLEEVTRRAPVLHLGGVAVPFAALHGFVQAHDADAFERAGFIVSPAYGMAFAPQSPDWVTALARHCIATWRALQ